MNGIAERLGASLRRGPYVWLALTLALFLLVLSGLSPLVEDQDRAKTWIAVVATGFIAYAVVAALVLVPRFVLARSRQTKTENQIAVMGGHSPRRRSSSAVARSLYARSNGSSELAF